MYGHIDSVKFIGDSKGLLEPHYGPKLFHFHGEFQDICLQLGKPNPTCLHLNPLFKNPGFTPLSINHFRCTAQFVPCLETPMSRYTRKQTICICKTKGADQLCSNCTAQLISTFVFVQSLFFLNQKFQASCDCTGWFVLDLVRQLNFFFFFFHAKAQMLVCLITWLILT